MLTVLSNLAVFGAKQVDEQIAMFPLGSGREGDPLRTPAKWVMCSPVPLRNHHSPPCPHLNRT